MNQYIHSIQTKFPVQYRNLTEKELVQLFVERAYAIYDERDIFFQPFKTNDHYISDREYVLVKRFLFAFGIADIGRSIIRPDYAMSFNPRTTIINGSVDTYCFIPVEFKIEIIYLLNTDTPLISEVLFRIQKRNTIIITSDSLLITTSKHNKK